MAKQAKPIGKPEILTDGRKDLPAKSALMALAKGKKTINDYAKAAPAIDEYPPIQKS